MYFFQAVAPFHLVESVDQALGVGRDAETPLAHEFALHGVAAAHREATHHLVVGQHGAQFGAPVDIGVGQVGQAVVHEHLLAASLVPRVPVGRREGHLFGAGSVESVGAPLGKAGLERRYRLRALQLVVVVALVELDECPLGPLVVLRVAGAHLAAPVETEADFVELFAIACYVLLGGDGRMLARLYGVLLGGQAVGVVAHGVQHVVAAQPLVASIDVAGDVSQRVSHVESGTRWVGKHVQNIVVRPVAVVRHTVHLMLPPVLLPPRFYLSEIVFHFHSIV